jgi:hypothetical protein
MTKWKKMSEVALHPNVYENLLISEGFSKEKAKKIVDQIYLKQWGLTMEEHTKQLDSGDFSSFDGFWESEILDLKEDNCE